MSNFRLNARKPKGGAGLPTSKAELYLLHVEDIVQMPLKDSKGVLTSGDIVIKAARRFHVLYLTPTTQKHSRKTDGDVDSRGWKQSISGNYPGDSLEVNEFVKNNLNQGFVIVKKSCESELMKIYGSKDNPLYFTGTYTDDEKMSGYELTFEQQFKSDTPVLFYSGNILMDESAIADPDVEFGDHFARKDGSNLSQENIKSFADLLRPFFLDDEDFKINNQW